MTAWGSRADVLLNSMLVIDMYTLKRALHELAQDEFDWEPHAGAWGIRRREDCTTPNPSGDADGAWVSDQDWGIQAETMTAGTNVIEPMTTIGWLLNHIGAAPGLTAELIVRDADTPRADDVYLRMWGYTILPTADEAVARFREGWSALDRALRTASDEALERNLDGHPWGRADLAITAMLNEVSHHGTQVCTLRDLYARR